MMLSEVGYDFVWSYVEPGLGLDPYGSLPTRNSMILLFYVCIFCVYVIIGDTFSKLTPRNVIH